MTTAPLPADAPQGDAMLEAIRGDVACPACDYSLRGLRGAVVTCPECGERCDIARLVSRRWTKPWWKAPGFNATIMPAVWAMVVGIGGWLTLTISLASGSEPPTLMIMGGFLVAVIVWAWLMWRAWRVFGEIEGVLLAMLAHLIAPIFLIAAWVGVFSAVAAGYAAYEQRWTELATFGVVCVVCAAAAWMCRRGERFIGGRCIRNYLRERDGIAGARPGQAASG